MVPHSGYIPGDLDTGDSGCHSLKDKLTGMYMVFPGAPGPDSEVVLDSHEQYNLVADRSQGAWLLVEIVGDRTSYSTSLSLSGLS